MSAGIRITVECYSGHKADERPLRFMIGEHPYVVDEVLDRWYGPDDDFFKVRAADGNHYILGHSRSLDDYWTLESFCQVEP